MVGQVYIYDLSFLVLFVLVVSLFLYKHRARAKWEGVMLLYRTQVGIKFIDYVNDHFGKYISKLKWVIITTGYISMVVMSFLLLQLLYVFIRFPEVVQRVKIPPIAPLIPYLPELFKVDFLPPFYFTYWILAIAVIALSHEFAHGIFAKINRVRVKSTGFGFLGPFLAAFVEPDEEQMAKIKKSDQLAILGAGSFANILMTILFLCILWIFFLASFSPAGFTFNTYAFSVVNISSIEQLGGIPITSPGQISGILALPAENRTGKQVNGHNFTEAVVGTERYYVENELIEYHMKHNFTQTYVYENSPALASGLQGVIVEVDGKKVRDQDDLKNILSQKNPGETTPLTTSLEGKLFHYTVRLGRNPLTGKGYLGVATINGGSGTVTSKIRNLAIFFRKPSTYYAPRYNPELITFIYDLLGWIVLINISVALMNMLPVGIFDGGRVFYLTLWAIFKTEKAAKRGYKIATHVILWIFILLTAAWVWHTFFP